MTTKAYLFTLPDQDNVPHSLKYHLDQGQTVVLYFYPKDMTSGCTLEAHGFSDLADEFEKINVKVFGISIDPVESHKKFCDKEKLHITLLSDVDKKVVEAYGVWVLKSMYGKKYMGIQRDSFVIDSDGTIIKHFEKVKPEGHPQEVLAYLRSRS